MMRAGVLLPGMAFPQAAMQGLENTEFAVVIYAE